MTAQEKRTCSEPVGNPSNNNKQTKKAISQLTLPDDHRSGGDDGLGSRLIVMSRY